MRNLTMRKTKTGLPSLPGRLPSGTRYVIEGRRSKSGRLRIVSRQVILPSGEQIDVAAPASEPAPQRRKSTARRRRA
jgi:hypothetical protein